MRDYAAADAIAIETKFGRGMIREASREKAFIRERFKGN